MHVRTVIAAVVICVALIGCTIPLGDSAKNVPPPPEDADALGARLDRCAALGAAAVGDADCQSAWAEARRRILPPPEQ